MYKPANDFAPRPASWSSGGSFFSLQVQVPEKKTTRKQGQKAKGVVCRTSPGRRASKAATASWWRWRWPRGLNLSLRSHFISTSSIIVVNLFSQIFQGALNNINAKLRPWPYGRLWHWNRCVNRWWLLLPMSVKRSCVAWPACLQDALLLLSFFAGCLVCS